MQLTAQQLKLALGSTVLTAERWVEPLNEAFRLFGISTPKRVAAFLAQVGHESTGLTKVVEGLNYSAPALARTWPNRYAVDPKAKDKIPNALAQRLARKPEAIANNAYANRMGNGSEASGDGWRYRGRGPIQNTGEANYAGMRDTLRAKGIKGVPDFVATPEALEDPKWGALAAGAFWESRNLNGLADAGRFDEITQRINNGQTGQADRRERYARAVKVLGA